MLRFGLDVWWKFGLVSFHETQLSIMYLFEVVIFHILRDYA